MPILLAAVAGFVDACTFLGLFGFFVAQVTGSYVLLGAVPMAGLPGLAVVLAVPVFLTGGAAATLAAIAGQAVLRRPLTAALTLETLLLTAFAASFAASAPAGAAAYKTAAAMFGLAAMGVQSAAVRLLMHGTASTNVMTTATTQIAIDATQVAWAWLCHVDGPAETLRQLNACRRRLRDGLPLPLGFLLGTLLGAVGFVEIGDPVLATPAAVTGALAMWTAQWERGAPADGR
jgi:uncharacterized membrane protein YoaK (UPF0700 family)